MSDDYWQRWECDAKTYDRLAAPLARVKTTARKAATDMTSQFEKLHRNGLRKAFKAFASEGRWDFLTGPAIAWEVHGSTTFGDGFPVSIRLMPRDLVRAFQDLIEGSEMDDPEQVAELKRCAEAWRRAVNDMFSALDTSTETR